MSKKFTAHYKCDICPFKVALDENSTELREWKEVRFHIDGQEFDPIDICPACQDPSLPILQQTERRIGVIITRAIESVADTK